MTNDEVKTGTVLGSDPVELIATHGLDSTGRSKCVF